MGSYRALISKIPLLLVIILFGFTTFTAAQGSSENVWLIFSAAMGNRGDIYRMRLDGSDLQNLTQSADGIYQIEALSPDQQWIYFNEENHIYRIRTDGSERQQLTRDGDDRFTALSPDGEWVFFTRDIYTQIYRVRSDGSEVSRVPAMPYFPNDYGWSPDGAWLFFMSEQLEILPSGLYRMSADGSTLENTTELLEQQGIHFNNFSFYSGFLPDGEWLLFSCAVGERYSSICRMRYDGSEAQELTPFNTASYDITRTLDGEWLIFSSYTGEDFQDADLYRMHLDGSAVQQVTDFPARTEFDGFTPDGQQILVWVGEYLGQKDLYRMNLDGSESEILFSTDTDLYSMGWSPDGRWRLFSAGDYLKSQQEIYRATADGEQFENITHNPGYYVSLGWSPDGEWLLYAFGEVHASPSVVYGHLYRININSLEVQLLTPEPAFYSLGQFYRVEGD